MIADRIKQEMQDLNALENQVRQFFKPKISAFHCITYAQFVKHFPIDSKNYKQLNLNIIDMHLRYRQFVKQDMAKFKWIPIVLATPLLMRRRLALVAVPFFYCKFFDYYFEHFFIWRHKDEKIINMRYEFVCKLSKPNYKIRRIELFDKLKGSFLRTDQSQENIQPPHRYIKFGEYTQHIFHSSIGTTEQSNILQTSLFQTYMIIRDFITKNHRWQNLKNQYHQFTKQFVNFRMDPERNQIYLNEALLISHPDIFETEKYTFEGNIEQTIRRYIELFIYAKTGKLEISGFNVSDWMNFTKYYEVFEPYKYNVKNNGPDLFLYYGIVLIPHLFKAIKSRL